MAETNKRVLAMYDIRGIQNYIYKTAKVQDAIGASKIVEDIIEEALENAVKNDTNAISYELEWYDKDAVISKTNTDGRIIKEYNDEAEDIQVLYIGGGNAFVSFRDRELCLEINKKMSKYVLEHTYSLQLAIAITEKTNNYADDYDRIFSEMVRVKACMEQSLPLGAFPVMDIEIKSGLPKSKDIPAGLEYAAGASRETYLKKLAEKKDEERYSKAKEFDKYIEKKGEDSILAVVHIDGNNMGLRIRSLISEIKDYTKAVNQMRKISYQISSSYKKAYEDMEQQFNKNGEENNVLKILVAGDDITYVCKGKYAIATVEYLSREISKKTMDEDPNDLKEKSVPDQESLNMYGFSVCAGIAYIHSHFPFSIGYEVAEKCCDSAKEQAKKIENQLFVKEDSEKKIKYYKVGNWFDFQVCKNVQTEDLDGTRAREYITKSGENLLIRPYELPLLNIDSRKDAVNKIEDLKKNITFFQASSIKENTKITGKQDGRARSLPRSHAKALRNYYAEGEAQTNSFAAFLRSRHWIMPDGTQEMYCEVNGSKRARWYDAIELIDLYEPLECMIKGEGK